MSLFKARDLWSYQCGEDEEFDQSSIAIANIGSHSDKIIVGSHNGFLRVFQPSSEKLENGPISAFKPTDLLIEMHLPQPIIEVGVGKLISGSPNLQLSILHPRSVAVYSLTTKTGATEHGDQSHLVLAYEHILRRTAFSMVVGPFGGVQGRDFLCVQSLDGILSFFEQETFAFNRFLPGFLLPGPFVFLPHTDSFLTVTSNYHAESYRYQVLAEAGDATDQDGSSGRKIVADWSYNIGEAALDVAAVTWSISNCDIIILGEKNIFCLKDNGTIKFMKRLEYTPCCFHSYYVEPDGKLMVLVVTDTDTLLVYEKTMLRWSAQLTYSPTAITRGNFRNIKGAIVLLSDTGQLQCCYLGTEPSLFLAPPLETNAIDFQESEKELRELQKIIKARSKANTASLTSTAAERELVVTIAVSPDLEPCSFSHNLGYTLDNLPEEHLPMCRVSVELLPHAPLSKVQVSVVVQPPLIASQVSCTISSLCEKSQVVTYVYVEEEGCDISTMEVRVITSYMTSVGGYPRVLQSEGQLPLKLVCASCTPTKETEYKVTLNTNQPPVNLSQLFPEFAGDASMGNTGGNALGIQWLGRKECAVTILSAKSSQRYRLQADSAASLCLFTSQLVHRLNRHFSKTKAFSCTFSSSLPLHELFSEIDEHFGCRQDARKLQEDLGLRTSQFRAIQRRLLMRFKDKTPTPLTNLNTLLRDTYYGIVASANMIEENQRALRRSSIQLSCALQLILLLLRLSVNSAEQELADLAAALGTAVEGTEEQGWEEVTDAATTFLLRTSLAKSIKDKQRPTPLTLDPIRDTTKLKKHVSSALDRISKSSRLLDRRPDTGKVAPRSVSPIFEAGEPLTPEEEAVVPAGSKLAERKNSAPLRGRSALQARRLQPLQVSDPGSTGGDQKQLGGKIPSAVVSGVIESPPEIFSSTDDADIW